MQFQYLGNIETNDGRRTEEIQIRTSNGRNSFQQEENIVYWQTEYVSRKKIIIDLRLQRGTDIELSIGCWEANYLKSL